MITLTIGSRLYIDDLWGQRRQNKETRATPLIPIWV